MGAAVGRANRLEDIMSESGLVDITVVLVHRRRRLVTGRGAPPNTGLRYPADAPTVEEIILVMRQAGPGRYAERTRALIAILWRAGLRISEALASPRPIWIRRPGRSSSAPARAGSAGRLEWTTGHGSWIGSHRSASR